MKKLLTITLLLIIVNYNALTASDTSCQRLIEMLSEQLDLKSSFATTAAYQQCTLEKDALTIVTRSPKPGHALVIAQQLVQDGHKVTPEHLEQSMHAYWAGRFQAGTVTSSWALTTDQDSLQNARAWTEYAQHNLALARFLTNAAVGSRNCPIERYKKIDFDRLANERTQDMHLIEDALQNSRAQN